MHHPKADIDRPYVKRKGAQSEATCKAEIIKYCRIVEHKICRPVCKYC